MSIKVRSLTYSYTCCLHVGAIKWRQNEIPLTEIESSALLPILIRASWIALQRVEYFVLLWQNLSRQFEMSLIFKTYKEKKTYTHIFANKTPYKNFLQFYRRFIQQANNQEELDKHPVWPVYLLLKWWIEERSSNNSFEFQDNFGRRVFFISLNSFSPLP